MAYEGYLEFNGVEIVNVARTGALAFALGLGQVQVNADRAAVLQSRVRGIPAEAGSVHYRDITLAPWYDPGYEASHEFAGLMPMSIQGLDDSTLQADVTEYITDGGHTGQHRNTTLSIVASVTVLASSERGAEYGKRWLSRVLRGLDTDMGTGYDVRYLRDLSLSAQWAKRRQVNVTRSPVITRKRTTRCLHAWTLTFTLTAGDAYEYGEPEPLVTSLGGANATSPVELGDGVFTTTETPCPTYDYTPLYDPLYPALVPSPTAPRFLPQGWDLEEGQPFKRQWITVIPPEPSEMTAVPVIKFTATQEARMVRLMVLPPGADPTDVCSAMFTVVLTYLPPDTPIYVDGVRRTVYAWDGFSPTVKRADTLAYGNDGNPVVWSAFGEMDELTVVLDTMATSNGSYQGGGTVRVSVDLVSRSD